MKALTICQPYAELICRGVKPIENRTWPTSHRGALAIHAGKSREFLSLGDEAAYPDLPFGAMVATATLYDCVRLEDLPAPLIGHEHAHGPWCWLLRDVVRLPAPRPMRGAQGLWEWDPHSQVQPAASTRVMTDVAKLVEEMRVVCRGRTTTALLVAFTEMYARVLSNGVRTEAEMEQTLASFSTKVRGWWLSDRGGSGRVN